MGESEARRRAAWRFVRAVVRSEVGGVMGAVVSGLLWQTGAILAPLIVSYTIDHGVVPQDRHALTVWLLALLGVGLLEVVAGGLRHIFAIRNRSATDARVRDAIFAHALRLDAAYHDRVGPGELMSRASSDSEHVARMMDAIGHTIGYALTVVAVAVVIVWPLRIFGQRGSTLQTTLAASARITEVLPTEARLREPRHPRELEHPVGCDVRLEGIRFGHEGEKPVLDGLELDMRAGE